MSKFILGLMLVLCTQAFGSNPLSKEVYITMNDAFVPDGIKSSDEAYVVLSGMFSNSCYSWNRGEVRHTSEFSHTIQAVANLAQTKCLMVMIPYSKQVSLGRLSRGDHTLRFLNGDDTYFERTLTIQ